MSSGPHKYREIKLDGTLKDVVAGMSEFVRNADVMDWGCRALMDLATADGMLLLVDLANCLV